MRPLIRSVYRLRAMTVNDLEIVLEWRNSETVRLASYTDHLISMDEHQAWFERTSSDETSYSLVLECEDRPTGVVNITIDDIRARRSTWGFYIGDSNAPRGTGTAMGFMALDFVFDGLKMHKLVGEAMVRNKQSVGFHRRLGFSKEGLLRDHVWKDDQYEDVVLLAHFDQNWAKVRPELETRLFGSDDGS